MTLHFENLWEKCEEFHQENSENDNSQEIVDELLLKINIYKTVSQKSELLQDLQDEQRQIKSRLMGEILLTLTNLSLKDNINVYEALNVALQQRSIESYSEKYQAT